MNSRKHIRRLQTAIPGLEQLLGGGIPEFSLNLIAGPPGSGKTTLAHQLMFSMVSRERTALYFTVLGEPTLKMLRYQQQFPFFDVERLNDSIRFCNLAPDLLDQDFHHLLAKILDEVQRFSPGLIFIDSFTSLAQPPGQDARGSMAIERFVHELGAVMAGWLATTFIIGEYDTTHARSGPLARTADGILALSQVIQDETTVRRIEVVKMRGQAQSPGPHAFRIGDDGLTVFPRTSPGQT